MSTNEYPLQIRDWAVDTALGRTDLTPKFLSQVRTVGNTFEDLSMVPAGVYPFLSVAEPVKISAGGNAGDDASGIGATLIAVQGLDENFNEIVSYITTAGVSASAVSAESFIRVKTIAVIDTGAYGATNLGDITLEGATSATVLAFLEAGQGFGKDNAYTVPLGKKGIIRGADIYIDSNKVLDVRLLVRDRAGNVSVPFGNTAVIFEVFGETGYSRLSPDVQFAFPELSDVWWQARTTSGTGTVTVLSYIAEY